MRNTIPRYIAPHGAETLERRMTALLKASHPTACPVYIGLADPTGFSARHAHVTHTIAAHLARRETEKLPSFNTSPPPALRVLGAASMGRSDAVGNEMEKFPHDLASNVWWKVEQLTRMPHNLSIRERKAAVSLLLRLGYISRALAIAGVHSNDLEQHVFTPEMAVSELAVLRRLTRHTELLETRALAVAHDEDFPLDVRIRFATFVIASGGRRGANTAMMQEAAQIAQSLVSAYEETSFTKCLTQQTVHRAAAFLPFMQGNKEEALALLEHALTSQLAAEPSSELEEMAWKDHAFPLFETITKTHLLSGNISEGVHASEKLVALNPHDARTWFARGRVLLEGELWDEALEAYSHVLPLGGFPVAEAAFYMGWIHAQRGEHAQRDHYYQLSQIIDPTVPITEIALQ